MVMELEQGDTLHQYLSERRGILLEARAKSIAMKLAQGIEYLHEYGILIGKLNVNTIMMTDRSDQALPRISNLSRATVLMPFQKSKDKVEELPCNMAPEVCFDQAYDHKVDTWSFGVILYQLLSG